MRTSSTVTSSPLPPELAAAAGAGGGDGQSVGVRSWTFLTNHAHVLLCLAKNEAVTVRELSLLIGITERAVHTIISDLVESGYLIKTKAGRRNVYTVCEEGRLRHPLEAHHTVNDLITALD